LQRNQDRAAHLPCLPVRGKVGAPDACAIIPGCWCFHRDHPCGQPRITVGVCQRACMCSVAYTRVVGWLFSSCFAFLLGCSAAACYTTLLYLQDALIPLNSTVCSNQRLF
jgi:hypothetical protein